MMCLSQSIAITTLACVLAEKNSLIYLNEGNNYRKHARFSFQPEKFFFLRKLIHAFAQWMNDKNGIVQGDSPIEIQWHMSRVSHFRDGNFVETFIWKWNEIKFLESTPWETYTHTHLRRDTSWPMIYMCVTLHIISYRMNMKTTNTYDNVCFFQRHTYDDIQIYKRL